MQRQRDGLVPIGEALADLGGLGSIAPNRSLDATDSDWPSILMSRSNSLHSVGNRPAAWFARRVSQNAAFFSTVATTRNRLVCSRPMSSPIAP